MYSSVQNTDTELEQKVKKATEKISENLHIVANEPSLALYRLQEHIRKSLPQLVEKRLEVNRMYQDLQGKCYDAEYAVHAVKSTHLSSKNFQNIQDLLKNAIFIKQQLAYEENRRHERKSQPSMYQRLSSLSLDLPDLPDALRPVALVLSASSSEAHAHPHAPVQSPHSQGTFPREGTSWTCSNASAIESEYGGLKVLFYEQEMQ